MKSLGLPPKALSREGKIGKLDLSKIFKILLCGNPVKIMKDNQRLQILCVNSMSDKGLVS